MAEIAPHFDRLDAVTPAAWGPFGAARKLNRAPFASPIANFYMTDPIGRASPGGKTASRVCCTRPSVLT